MTTIIPVGYIPNKSLKDTAIELTQKRLDDFANTRDYQSILSACSYANSSIPEFAIDGQYCTEARDMTWKKLYEVLFEIESDQSYLLQSYQDIENKLPLLIWP